MSIQKKNLKSNGLIFYPNNKYVRKGWQKLSSQSQKLKNQIFNKSVTLQKLVIFIQYVFSKFQKELQMDVDLNTNFIDMIEAYKDQKKQNKKDKFSFQQAVELINWAVQGENAEYLQKGQSNVKSLFKSNQKLITKNNQKQTQKNNQIQSNQNTTSNKKYPLMTPRLPIQQLSTINLPTTPISIKKQLAMLKQQKKSDFKINFTPLMQKKVQKNQLKKSEQIKYFKKMKIKLKNTKRVEQINKSKINQYHPEKIGLKQLFRFYCQLHSQFNHKKASNTFDQFETKVNLMYMHNFMLLAKDFELIQPHLPSNNQKKSKIIKQKIKKSKQYQKQKDNSQKLTYWDRNTISNLFKKQADYHLNVTYEKFLTIIKTICKNKYKKQQKQLQDKNQLNQISNKDLQKKQQSQNSIKSQSKINQKNQKKIEKIQQKGQKLQNYVLQKLNMDEQTYNLCKLLKIDTFINYEQTMKKIKMIQKVYNPSLVSQNSPLKKQQILNSRLDTKNDYKGREKQKQVQNLEAKVKYLSKFEDKNINPYTSFKGSNILSNQLKQNHIPGLKKLLTQEHSPFAKSKTTENTYGNLQSLRMSRVIQEARQQLNLKNQNQFIIMKNKNLLPQISATLGQTQTPPQSICYKDPIKFKQSKSTYLQSSKLHTLNTKINHLASLSQVSSLNFNEINMNKQERQKMNNEQINSIKSKKRDINIPLLKIMGCDEDDQLLNKYFDKENENQIKYDKKIRKIR